MSEEPTREELERYIKVLESTIVNMKNDFIDFKIKHNLLSKFPEAPKGFPLTGEPFLQPFQGTIWRQMKKPKFQAMLGYEWDRL